MKSILAVSTSITGRTRTPLDSGTPSSGVAGARHRSSIKVWAIGALLLPLAGMNAFALSAPSIPKMDSRTGATALAATPDGGVNRQESAPSAADPKLQTSSLPQTHLAPAAPINSSMPPVSVEEDIRDIRSPRHLPNPLLWAAYAAGALALSVAGLGAWLWHRRARLFAKLPYEIALDRLEEARRFMTPEHTREFCFAVSEVIRSYIEQRFESRASHRTTEEFLRDLLEEKKVTLVSHRELLAEFLQHCDMAKFALWQFSRPEMEAMHSSARAFVVRSAIDPVTPENPKSAVSLAKSPRLHLDPPVAASVHVTPKPA